MTTKADRDWAEEIRRTLRRLRSGHSRVLVPPTVGLHRRRPGAIFHAYPEVFIQRGGGTEFECPGGRFVLGTGDVCIMPAGVPHGEVPLDLRTPYEILVVLKTGADGLIGRAMADAKREILSGGGVHLEGAGESFRLLDHAGQSERVHDEFRDGFLRGLAEAFLNAVLSRLLHPRAGESDQVPHLVAEAEKWIRLNISHPDPSVAAAARSLGCSPDHLSRRFRASRGMSLGSWLVRERLQMACDLLERSQHNVSEIAWACGFQRPSYFIRLFRSRMGVTPRAWREQAPVAAQNM